MREGNEFEIGKIHAYLHRPDDLPPATRRKVTEECRRFAAWCREDRNLPGAWAAHLLRAGAPARQVGEEEARRAWEIGRAELRKERKTGGDESAIWAVWAELYQLLLPLASPAACADGAAAFSTAAARASIAASARRRFARLREALGAAGEETRRALAGHMEWAEKILGGMA